MRHYGKYGRGSKSLSLAEALYGPAAATKESAPLLEIQEESTTRREAPAAHGEADLRLELRSAVEHLNRVQSDYYTGLRPRADLNEAMCRVGDLKNRLGLEPMQKPTLSTAVSRPQWKPRPLYDEE